MIMKQLRSEFKRDGHKYRIIDRSHTVYLAEVMGEYGGRIGYEVGRILFKKAHEGTIHGKTITFGGKERIPSSEEFGNNSFDRFFPPSQLEQAKRQFKLASCRVTERVPSATKIKSGRAGTTRSL